MDLVKDYGGQNSVKGMSVLEFGAHAATGMFGAQKETINSEQQIETVK